VTEGNGNSAEGIVAARTSRGLGTTRLNEDTGGLNAMKARTQIKGKETGIVRTGYRTEVSRKGKLAPRDPDGIRRSKR